MNGISPKLIKLLDRIPLFFNNCFVFPGVRDDGVEDAGAGGAPARGPWPEHQAGVQLQPGRRDTVFGEMVQRRERVLSIRAAGQTAGARLSAARCHGERKNHILLIFLPGLVPVHLSRLDPVFYLKRVASHFYRVLYRLAHFRFKQIPRRSFLRTKSYSGVQNVGTHLCATLARENYRLLIVFDRGRRQHSLREPLFSVSDMLEIVSLKK